jgi:hypothetical protein
MKTKLTLAAIGAALAVAIAMHVGHEPPKDGICPLGNAIHGK